MASGSIVAGGRDRGARGGKKEEGRCSVHDLARQMTHTRRPMDNHSDFRHDARKRRSGLEVGLEVVEDGALGIQIQNGTSGRMVGVEDERFAIGEESEPIAQTEKEMGREGVEDGEWVGSDTGNKSNASEHINGWNKGWGWGER